MRKNNSPIGTDWNDFKNTILTPEECKASDARISLMSQMIKIREEEGITQKEIEERTGIVHSVISRMETGKTSPQIDTIISVLSAMGYELKIEPISK